MNQSKASKIMLHSLIDSIFNLFVMGNANGRRDGEGSSGTNNFEANDLASGFLQSAEDDSLPESMGHSPFPSPRAPLFAPFNMQSLPGHHQMIHSQRQTICQPQIAKNDVDTHNLTRVKLSWNHGGKQVFVCGSWDYWETRELLQASGSDFHVVKSLPSGVYQYRFIVDGYYRCAPDFPWVCDSSGDAYNILDLQEYISELPAALSEFESPPSPPSSYDNRSLNEDDFRKPPPEIPPQLLQAPVLNYPSSSFEQMDNELLPNPQNSELNHLYIQNHPGDQFVGLGSTYRFKQKYVKMVLFKPSRKTSL